METEGPLYNKCKYCFVKLHFSYIEISACIMGHNFFKKYFSLLVAIKNVLEVLFLQLTLNSFWNIKQMTDKHKAVSGSNDN